MDACELSRPLFSRVTSLQPLPAQPEGAAYEIWFGGLPAPEDDMGYVVELTGRRRGRVIAWLQDGGRVYRCSEPLRDAPEQPTLVFARWANRVSEGCIDTVDADGNRARVSEFSVNNDRYGFLDPSVDLGPVYTRTRYCLREFMAAAYLAFVHLPSLDAGESGSGESSIGTMEDVLRGLLGLPPADAIDALIARVDKGEGASGFERFAAHQLLAADPRAFRRLCAAHEIRLGRLASTGLFWMRCDYRSLDAGEFDEMVAMEGALNRVALAARAAGGPKSAPLPRFSQAYYLELDARVMRQFADVSASYLAASSEPNELISLRGFSGKRGGDWDIRTRFAGMAERATLPYRLTYRFDVDAAAGELAVAFFVPKVAPALTPIAAMPTPSPDGDSDELAARFADPVRPVPGAPSVCYSLRVAVLLAEAAFGSSPGVDRVEIVGCSDAALSAPVLRAAFDRSGFVTGAHERLRSGDLSEAATAFEVEALSRLLLPAELAFELEPDGALRPLREIDAALAESTAAPGRLHHVGLAGDTRALPDDLAGLLAADTACELDIFSKDDDPFPERVAELYALAATDPIAAAQQAQDMLSAYELMESVSIGEADGGLEGGSGATGGGAPAAAARRPLYCSNNAARLACALHDPDPAVRYRRVPDSIFDALILLARLCIENDDREHGLQYARRASAFSPTSPQARVLAAGACPSPQESARECIEALRYDLSPRSYTVTFYRLAFALWNSGQIEPALACYQRALDNPEFAKYAQEEMGEMMRENGISERLTPPQVEHALAATGIPSPPNRDLPDLAARVSIRACDAGFPDVAALYIGLAVGDDGNDALYQVIRSLGE